MWGLAGHPLPENIFHFVEAVRIALGRLVLHLHRGVQLFDQLALLAGKFRRRQYAHMKIHIAASATVRVGQAFALQPENRAALRAFGDLQRLFPIQARHLQLRAQRRSCDAQRNRSVQIRAAPLKELVLLHFQNDIQIAGRPAVRPRLAFALHSQPRSRIHAGRNAQFDIVLALEAPLSVALRTAFLDDLPGALAIGTRAVHGEKSLLIDQLPAPAASLASDNPGALFRARAVARFAILHPRHANLGGDAHGRFVEGQRHVVAQVIAALDSAAPTAAATRCAEEVLEAEKVAENIVEILEDGAVKPTLRAGARQARVAVGVVNLALLRVAEDAVSLGAFPKTM